MSTSGSMKERIYERLTTELQPEKLDVINQSHLHAGHAGDDGSGESHFKIIIGCEALKALSYVNRERSIHKALSDEMPKIHALSIQFMS